jgi:hypothetical protein
MNKDKSEKVSGVKDEKAKQGKGDPVVVSLKTLTLDIKKVLGALGGRDG